jgi:hypothetical protein
MCSGIDKNIGNDKWLGREINTAAGLLNKNAHLKDMRLIS